MLRTSDPVRLDELVEYAARATRRCTPVRKRWGRALGGRDRATTHRHYTGDRHSPVTRTLELMEQLASADDVTPFPVLAECMAVVMQADIRKATTEELEARLAKLDCDEHDAEAAENRATARGSYTERAQAGMDAIAIELERVAILRELMRRERGA